MHIVHFDRRCQEVSTKSFVMCVSKTGSHYGGVERSDTTLAQPSFPDVIQRKVESNYTFGQMFIEALWFPFQLSYILIFMCRQYVADLLFIYLFMNLFSNWLFIYAAMLYFKNFN